ncbi:MAG: thioredoxin family protein, partial [Anaerolineales bacterium]|nr:thioredoxin family protein [Anaerolineales bacterium]
MSDFFENLFDRIRRASPGRHALIRWLAVCAVGLLLLTGSKKASAVSVLLPPGTAEEIQSVDPVYVYFFWGEGCPHCAQAKPFLESLAQKNPRIILRSYEIYYVAENHEVFERVCAAAGFEPRYVPTIVIGKRYWEGYGEQIAQEIQTVVNSCLKNGCPDAGAGIVAPLPTAQPTAAPTNTPRSSDPATDPAEDPDGTSPNTIHLPLIGSVELTGKSLVLSTALIAFVDSFNPCSLWVLTMLLTLTLHTGSRRKVLLIGVVFLTVTAAIYALFIAGLFTVFTIVS